MIGTLATWHTQVVVNPFIWKNMGRRGQVIPILFEEFSPQTIMEEKLLGDIVLHDLNQSISKNMTESMVLKGVMDIVIGALGSEV